MKGALFVLLGLLACGPASAAECDVMSPVVIVPGILGSVMEGQLAKSNHTPHWYCPKDKDWYTFWLSIEELLPGEVDCLSDNIKLHYDPATKTYYNTDGVKTRIPGFGNTTSVEYLDPALHYGPSLYFHAMVQNFVDKGYVRGKTIVGAPYDWRYSPNGFLKQNYYADLKNLIEKTYANGGNKSVVLVAHSMGAPVSLYFLTKYVTQAWKDTHLKAYVTISGVWRGAANAAKAFVSGSNENIFIDLPIWGRASQRTYPSTALLLPYPSDTWPKDEVLFVTPQRNYSAWDYKALFDDINYPRGYDMFLEVKDLTNDMVPPNVSTYCFFGTEYPTPTQFIYTKGEFPDTEPIQINGNGDGTVNINSLTACKHWVGQMSPYNVTVVGFPDVEHVGAVMNTLVLQHVNDVVCNLRV